MCEDPRPAEKQKFHNFFKFMDNHHGIFLLFLYDKIRRKLHNKQRLDTGIDKSHVYQRQDVASFIDSVKMTTFSGRTWEIPAPLVI
jgi:hypothetical protein